ncbi:MAG TPA: PLP-dependent aminotransferase family protein [Bacteroidales bacterium]|nr:PLP-dependent aminotransferase family protein [Bacteroidales bacterium]
MILNVDRNSKIPVFQQVVNQIIELINNGTLGTGEILPSSRDMAKMIGVNRTTVVRVYSELGAQGYVESSPGSYTTVRKRQSAISEQEDDIQNNSFVQNVFRDNHNLSYDAMMHYIENGKAMEKEKINFLQLSPDARLVDIKHTKACMRDILKDTQASPFVFTHARGYQPLRHEIVKQMKLHSIYANDKNVLITNGSLQSLQLIFQTFSKPGDYIAIENPSYSIMWLIAKIFQLNVIEIPITGKGMDLHILEKVLNEKPVRFIYVMPTYQNPTGLSMPQDKRERLVQLCDGKDCIIIEDSIEEELKYSGKTYLPVKAIDKKGQVIYLGTYTKVMAPGLRIGWIIGIPECIKKLTVVKSIFEISSTTISQMFLYNFLIRGAYNMHLRKIVRVFKKRMKIAVSAIKKYIPVEKIEWTEPYGGYMIWLKLLTKPQRNIENHFSDYGVLIHNGQYFFANEQPNNYIRICIAQTNEREIEEGIKRIGEAISALEYISFI